MSTRASGHSLAEALVALALMLLLLVSIASLLAQASRLSRTHPERLELHQRARVALDLITRDVRSAGAGVDLGPATGPLSSAVAPVWPRRLGRGGDAPTVVRATAVTLLAVPDSLAQTTTDAVVLPATAMVRVAHAAHCAVTRPGCGFAAGTTFGVFDRTGVLSVFTTDAAAGGNLTVRTLADARQSIAAGATAAELVVRGYEFDEAAGVLRYFDGDATSQTVIDGVSAFTLRYFDSSSEIPLAAFADGPWGGSGDTMFDLDLLRIRRLQIALRLEGVAASFAATVDVAPRNLGAPGGAPS